MKLVDDVGFDGAFSFAYSARPGTPAAELADTVPPDVAQRRLERLQTLLDGQYREHSAAMVGTRQRVLVTGRAVKRPGRPRRAHRQQPRRQLRRRSGIDRPLRRRHDHRRLPAFAARRDRERGRLNRRAVRRLHAPCRASPCPRRCPRRPVLTRGTSCPIRSPSVFDRRRDAGRGAGPRPVRVRDRTGGRVRRRVRRCRGRRGAGGRRQRERGDHALERRDRRCRRRGRDRRESEAVRRGDQGREGDGGAVPRLAEGREDLARDRARAVRHAVLLLGQPAARGSARSTSSAA